MNKERLLELADVIEVGVKSFNGFTVAFKMSVFFDHVDYDNSNVKFDKRDGEYEEFYKCNSAACIAGFAVLNYDLELVKKGHAEKMANPSRDRSYPDTVLDTLETKAQEILDLTYEEAQALFFGDLSPYVTGEMAAKVIRNFVDTGVVSWKVAYERLPE